jgi:uncharacterized repeat protein (TIGR03806 family)
LLAAATAASEPGEAVLADPPPRLISQFGFFPDGPLAEPAAGIVRYDLATPLFSDSALKYRAVFVPAGQRIAYEPDEAFQFPVGSALIKTFAYPDDFRRPGEGVRVIETRLLLRRPEGWLALAYVWNETQTDAELKIAGKQVPVEFVDRSGNAVRFIYSVPNKNQCKGCHELNGELVPLGPKARNLNRVFDAGAGPANQLEAWRDRSILDGLPPMAEISAAPNFANANEPLDARARAWLDVNCGHCHRDGGPASNAGLNLDIAETDPVRLGIGKRPAAAGRGAGDREFDIVAGEPDRSILLYRIESTEPGVMMPEVGRHLADPEGAALIREWIASLR